MKKTIGTKVKLAGKLAFATAMIFSFSGNLLAQDSQKIIANAIDDVTYSTTPLDVKATSEYAVTGIDTGLAVSYGVAGPATVDANGLLTMVGKGDVTVFYFQDGKDAVAATYEDDGTTIKTPAEAAINRAAPQMRSFTINGASATVALADATVVYTGTGQSLTPTQTDSAGATLTEPITVTYVD
ncbi:uncharacterized protein METZ01_LOCUS428756, partial [marine metagenome]